jgi:sacsin
LNDADTNTILEYLTSTPDCRYIAELPLVPSVSGTRVALTFRHRFGIVHKLFDETEEELFGTYDPTAISLKRVPSNVREKLSNSGRRVLNVENLITPKVIEFLATSPYSSHIQETATDAQVHWLDLFWKWAEKYAAVSAYQYFNNFYLVPTTSGIKRASDVVINPESDNDLAGILELLNVSVIDGRLKAERRGALLQLKPSSDIHSLLRSLPATTNIDLSEDKANYLGGYLIRQLPTACYSNGPLNAELRTRLRSLPIFPLLTPSPTGSATHRGSIVNTVDVRGVDPSIIPILPRIHSIVYLNLHRMSADILKYLNQKYHSPLSLEEMHGMMLNNFNAQSLEMQAAFVKYLASRSSIISRNVFDRLANIAFVHACDGSLQPPKQLIDPQAAIAALYPGASSLPDTSQPLLQTLVNCLRDLKLLVINISLEIVRERICHIASGTCPRPEELARRLITLINDYRLDCNHLFNTPNLPSSVEWIPTPEGLKSALGCRDTKSHLRKHDLFDRVMPMVCSDMKISDNLRRAFPWDGEVPFDVLSQQLVKVLDEPGQLYGKVREIVKEIGNRNLTAAQLTSLRELLTPRTWVPVRGQNLQTVTYALLGETDIPEIGFHSIAYDTYSHSKVRNFLEEMGCVE